MKKTLLLLILLSGLYSVHASDTLTIRQAFNFHVGDTFDYSTTMYSSGGFYGKSYERYLITARQITAGNDTLTYIRTRLYPLPSVTDSRIYYNLDSPVWYMFDSASRSHPLTLNIHHLPDGRVVDSVAYFQQMYPIPVNARAKFGEGLGTTDTFWDDLIFCNNGVNATTWEYKSNLIYFSKDSEQYGTPYYHYTDTNPLAHFTPIPEDCAFWNYSLNLGNNVGQIRTGNKTYSGNHTYIELLYRSLINNRLSGDSLLGYFRNDTANRKVLFTRNLSNAATVLYDFTTVDWADVRPPSPHSVT